MAKAVGCARKICRAELEEVPPNAMAGNVVVEMPSVVARVGTVNVPTYGLHVFRPTGYLYGKSGSSWVPATTCLFVMLVSAKISEVA